MHDPSLPRADRARHPLPALRGNPSAILGIQRRDSMTGRRR
jgi:hypothetical protein